MNLHLGATLVVAGVMLFLIALLGRTWGVSQSIVPVQTMSWYFVAGSVSMITGLFVVAGRMR